MKRALLRVTLGLLLGSGISVASLPLLSPWRQHTGCFLPACCGDFLPVS